ncbi:MAG: glycosyltransferase, partial [Actinomycetota bacterium]|nr:glycosyltransferase [Actinomycetota bacterium]
SPTPPITPTRSHRLRTHGPDPRLIVVSDGSTDDTDDVVRSYTDPRVQLIRSRRYGQAGGPRNDGLAISTVPACTRRRCP